LGAAGGDIRYRLASALSSDVIRDNYDRVIVDAPPRLSVALINALCASSCVLIPTKLDKTSGEAVGTFVREMIALRDADVCPELSALFVVASMTNKNIGQRVEDGNEVETSLLVSERQGNREIETALQRARKELDMHGEPARFLPLEASIQQLAAIAEATGPYTNLESARRMFQRLGAELMSRW
jgi:cellulose biosynthesis protein BcsQ